MKFSIIIPMYNVEQYIVRCLESVYHQDFNEQNFEVILVDDESPDNSLELAQEYLFNKSNFTIISQKNKGLGGARNTGIIHAKGDYLIFLDSDDWLLPNALSTLNKFVKSEDILEYAVSIRNSNKEINTIDFDHICSDSGCEYVLENKTINSACNKLYRREFILNNNLLFKEKIYGEDIEFNTRSFFFANKIISISEKLIVFYQSNNSITRNRSIDAKLKYLLDLKSTIISFSLFMRGLNNPKEEQMDYLNQRLCSLNVNTLLFAFKNKLPRNVVKNYVFDLKKADAFYFETNLKERNLFRKLMKNKLALSILIKLKTT